MARNSKKQEVSIPDLSWVEELSAPALEMPPPNAITRAQFAKMKGLTESRAAYVLDGLVESGKLDARRFTVSRPGGVSKIKYYWPK